MNTTDLLPYINSISGFFLEHQFLGVFFAGFISFIESLAIVGSIIPGSIVMTVVGCLLGIGAIPISYTMLSIFIGAFVGDFISYAIGAYFKDHIKNHRWIQPYKHWLLHGEAFMRKHGALSVLIGRFVGPMRSMIPMIAGIAQMNIIIFTLAIIPTIILWAIVYLTPGVLLGALSVDMGESLFSYFLSRSLIIILLFAIWHSLHTLIRIIYPHIQHIKFFSLINSTDLTHLTKGVLLISSALIFIFSINGIHPELHWINKSAYAFFLTQTTDLSISFSQFISVIMGHTTFLLLNAATVIVLYHHRYIKLTLAWVLMFGGLFCITAAIKYGLHIPRPNPLLDATSFPSGHILLTVTLFLFLSTLIETKSFAIGSAVRRASFVMMMLIALTRLILQAHWLSDIIFSSMLSLGIWHVASTWKHLIPNITEKHLKQVCASILLVLIPIMAIQPHLPDAALPKLPAPLEMKNNNPGSLPFLQYSRFGNVTAPLNFIYLGNDIELTQFFVDNNWSAYPTSGNIYQSIITLFQFREYQETLPLLPPLVNNKPPVMIFGKITDDSAYIAKLWAIGDGSKGYIGTLAKEIYPESFFSSKLFVCQKHRFNISNIISTSVYRSIQHSATDRIESLDAFCWDGETALIRSK